MKIKVTKDNVTIYKDELYHAGEYNIHNCTFEFSKEYTDILVKKALFGVDGKFYEMSILNNQCEIPYDVLKSNGMVILGVYAYEVLEDKLKLRYSPMYDKFFVNLGSYQENIENQEEITSTQFEQYMQALQNGLAEVQSSIDKLNETTDNANNLVDDINKKLESGEFNGVGITTITSGQATQQDDSTVTPVTVNKTDGSQQTFNVSAKNGINGTDGTNGQDGITPKLQIGTVTTLEPNEQATVTRTGTDEEPLLNFGIPKGQTYQVNKEDLDNIANEITSNANSSFNQNVKNKTDSFNENSSLKTNEFNNNAAQKALDYNNNCISKLNSFNSNADLRMDEYNANADNKIAEYDEHSQELNNKIIDTRNELERVKNDVLETGTDTDTFIHVEDSAMAEMQELSVDGVCEQETTTGKNLLANTNGTTQTINGVTFTKNNDGTITANGTATDGINYYINGYNYTDIEPNTYYLSDKVIGESEDTYFTYYEFKNNDVYNLVTHAVKTRTISSKLEGRSRIAVRSGQTLNNIVFKPMLEIGSKETDFEPYTGGQPSPSPDYPQEIKTITDSLIVTSCNKNLFDKNKPNILNAYINSTNGTIESDNVTSIFVKCKQNTNYTISKIISSRFIVGTTSVIPQNKVICNTFKRDDSATHITISTNSNDKYLIVYVSNSKDELILNKIFDSLQIEENLTVTSFEEHLQSQITANLPEGEFIGKISDTYKDTLKVEYNEEEGQYHLMLDKMISKFVLDGSEDWNYYTETNKPIFFIDTATLSHKIDYLQESGLICYCNYFAGKGQVWNFNDVYDLGNNVIAFRNSYKRLAIRDDRYINAKDFKNWLSTHNTEVYYALETPYTVDLGVVDMPLSYNEITNIFTDSDLLPKINAKYYRNFISTVRNLQVNEKALKQELIDINNRLCALESANTSTIQESEVVE